MMAPPTRRLTTIVALDIAGYSARMEADEAEATAAEAAFALAERCEPKVRVGVHLGDVVVQANGDLLGHGVNVAARLMARCEPGAALVSADVRRTIRGPLADRLVSCGILQLDKDGGDDRGVRAGHRCPACRRGAYAAHLGLVDDAYRLAATARLGPACTADDMMGPDGYRPALAFHAGMPELRADPRFVRLCARLGLVEYWVTTDKWPDCVGEVPYDFKAECEQARHIPIEDVGF